MAYKGSNWEFRIHMVILYSIAVFTLVNVLQPPVNTSQVIVQEGKKGDAFTFKDFTPAQLASFKGQDSLSHSSIVTRESLVPVVSQEIIERTSEIKPISFHDLTQEQLDSLKGSDAEPSPKLQIQKNESTGDIETKYENERWWKILISRCEYKECTSGSN